MAKKVNFIFTIEKENPFIYCRRLKKILNPNPNFWKKYCLSGCPYFNGSNQGNGVECKFENVLPYDFPLGFANILTNRDKRIIKELDKKIGV